MMARSNKLLNTDPADAAQWLHDINQPLTTLRCYVELCLCDRLTHDADLGVPLACCGEIDEFLLRLQGLATAIGIPIHALKTEFLHIERNLKWLLKAEGHKKGTSAGRMRVLSGLDKFAASLRRFHKWVQPHDGSAVKRIA